jgi:hypothetical protein
VTERIERRTRLDADLPVTERAEAVAAIEAEESARGCGRRLRGSISRSRFRSPRRCCGRCGCGTQSLIADAHHAAVAEMVAFIEREVAATRVGAAGRNGAVAQADVRGDRDRVRSLRLAGG